MLSICLSLFDLKTVPGDGCLFMWSVWVWGEKRLHLHFFTAFFSSSHTWPIALQGRVGQVVHVALYFTINFTLCARTFKGKADSALTPLEVWVTPLIELPLLINTMVNMLREKSKLKSVWFQNELGAGGHFQKFRKPSWEGGQTDTTVSQPQDRDIWYQRKAV